MDMRFLYLEQISDAVRTVDLEEQLATLLDPDFFVSLCSGQNCNRTHVGSCSIEFPTFSHTYASYAKSQQLELLQSGTTARLNWIRSPRDAHRWYTRQVGVY